MPVLHYPLPAIELLTGLVGGRLENARLLANAGFPELALVFDALQGKEQVLVILKNNNQFIIAAFLTAILTEERGVVPFLIKQKAPHWAATANAINKDESAYRWLRQNNLNAYAELAKTIRKKLDDDEGSGFEFLYKPPF